MVIAQQRSEELGLKNVEFVHCDIYECRQFVGQFNLVYCRSLLIHLVEPIKAITAMIHMLTPGGILACEEYNLSSCFSYPDNLALTKINQLFAKLANHYHLDVEIGNKLFGIFQQLKLVEVGVNLLQVTATKADDKALFFMGLKERESKLLENNFINLRELNKLYKELELLNENPEIFIAYWRFCQTWGRKKCQ